MIVNCLADCQVVVGNAEYVFESIDGSPNVYQVKKDVGAAAIATRNCVEIVVDDEHPYNGPAPESPIIHPLPAPEPVVATAPKTSPKPNKKPGTED